MKCDKVLPQLSDYIDELLTTEDKSLIEEHMKQCSSCANELQKLSKTVALVRSLPKMSAPINLQREISQAITPTPWLKIYKSLSLAAGLLLSFVLGMWFVIFQNSERFTAESAVAKSQNVPQETTPKIQKQNEVKVRLPRKQKESPEFFNAQRDLTQKKRSQSPEKNQVGTNKANSVATRAEKEEKEERKEITKFTRPGNMGRENNESNDKGTNNETVELDEMDDFAGDVMDDHATGGGSTTQLETANEESPTHSEDIKEMKDSASAEMSNDPAIEVTQEADASVQAQEGNAFADDNYQSLPPSQNAKSKNDKHLFGKEQQKTAQRVKQRRDRQTQTTCNKCHVEAIEVMHEQLVAKISLKTLHESLSACNKCHIILDEEIIRKGHIVPRTTITSIVDDQNGSIAEQIFVVQKMIQLEYALRGLAKAKTEGRLAKYARRKIAVVISILRKNEYVYHEKYIKPALVKVITARLRIGNRDLENVADFVREQARSITLLPIEDLNNLEKMPLEEMTEDEDDLKK